MNERILDVDAAPRTDDQNVRPRQQLVGRCDDARAKNAQVAGAVENLSRGALVKEHEVRVRSWSGVRRVDEIEIQRPGGKSLVMNDVDSGMRVPTRLQVRDVCAVHRSLRGTALRGRHRVTVQGQGDGQRERRDDADHGA